MGTNYHEITEQREDLATQEQIERIYHRYHFVSQYSKGRSVLEVGCGSGLGLGYLAKNALEIVGGDIDERNVSTAAHYYEDNDSVRVIELDAHNLPFPKNSFDLVILLESIYYLEDPATFIKEAHRVLREQGNLIIGTVNKNWKDFHPSKHSFKYYSIPELHDLLREHFSSIAFFGAFEVDDHGIKSTVISFIRRFASRLNLIPGSLKARERLKRIFIGKLSPLTADIFEGGVKESEAFALATDQENSKFKIIYALAGDKRGPEAMERP